MKPTCPNHGCPLDGLPFPIPRKGEGICPVSGQHFAFAIEQEQDAIKRDINGNLIKSSHYNVSGND